MDYVTKRLSINLTALHGSRVIEQYDEDGHLERGIFIPLERNGLYEGKRKCIYLYAFVNFNHWRKDESYQIVQSVTNAIFEKFKQLGYGRTVLGFMRDVKSKYSWRPHSEYVAQVITESKNKKK